MSHKSRGPSHSARLLSQSLSLINHNRHRLHSAMAITTIKSIANTSPIPTPTHLPPDSSTPTPFDYDFIPPMHTSSSLHPLIPPFHKRMHPVTSRADRLSLVGIHCHSAKAYSTSTDGEPHVNRTLWIKTLPRRARYAQWRSRRCST